MNAFNINLLKLTFRFLITLSLFISFNSHAFYDSRAEKFEFFLAPQFTNSKILQFENGAEADINEGSNIGFGFGYNFNHHFELSVLFASSSSNYEGTRVFVDGSLPPEKFTSNMYTSSIDIGFTFNLLSTPFTPYVTANIGSTFIDSGIPTGNIGSGCWWDPWYGYICTPVAQTYTATEFTYGAGVGVRYDFNRKIYVKAGVEKSYIDIGSSNTPDFTSYQMVFGLMF